MTTQLSSRGFAILIVLWIVAILSAIALGSLSLIKTEARIATADQSVLVAEQLARSGQEMAAYLAARRLGTSTEDLSGLPVESVIPGLHYRIHFPNGTVDLYLEAETGKINPGTADPVVLQNFFTLWTGSSDEGRRLTAAIQDWRDGDSDERDEGAEAPFYSNLGYLPRNAAFGIGDLPLVRGLSFGDFRARYLKTSSGWEARDGLANFMTWSPINGTINPNFAPELILLSIPGLDSQQAATIVQMRRSRLFQSADQLAAAGGIAAESPAWRYLSFERNTAAAVLTIGRADTGTVVRSERRVYQRFSNLNLATGILEGQMALAFVEHNTFPDFTLRD
jgi:type II secretory pathway component PulK